MPILPTSSADRQSVHAAVIGYGSIGQRHARILEAIGCSTVVVSRRDVRFPRTCRSIGQAVSEADPDYVVVANETAAHFDAVRELGAAGFRGRLLVEKPLFQKVAAFPRAHFSEVCVAYNLRFHPVLAALHALLKDETPISASVYVGQYLPDWRPGSDYRQSYSAVGEQGGGVLRDLSHDIDYACWLLGRWKRVAALGGKFSDLEISSDDCFALLFETERCPVVTVQMSYLDRVPRRQIVINTRNQTFCADLVANRLTVGSERRDITVERDTTYRAMHEAILRGDGSVACNVEEAMDILRLIEAAEQAATSGNWVVR